MKITRHAAPDMRQALKAVREQLGPDAVILSSRRMAGGVEVTAAMDFDAEDIAAAELAPRPAAAPAVSPPPAEPSPNVVAMESELKTLRRVLETQLARLAWNDLARRAPIHTEMLRELTEVGIAADLASEVVATIPAGTALTQARRLSIATIAQRVLVTGDRWLAEGGRIAFVGPTGVGKSTTLAKLAARWVLNHGPRELALVAGDSQRFGAHGELESLGQLLGAPVYAVDDFAQLPVLLERLARKRCVLIDTAGVSH
ncbi:MAG: flagellar biosynthesis protein FlhF, partial [Steroidobacteraceae bacterium]